MKKVILGLAVLTATSLFAECTLYKPCAGCHGAKGEKKALGKSAVITGMKADTVVESLKAYKAGTLNKNGMGALMKGQVSKLSDEDMKKVAAHIEGLK